ncbi:MAG: hypothetical protein BWY86_00896 [Candidatus Aminicenantes bacterium ADurb.Bin508]|nr:MAG: hypothetical protein BWY86_00896 [Candidatus Aminicenantes bacterium ADurb.Bin508]
MRPAVEGCSSLANLDARRGVTVKETKRLRRVETIMTTLYCLIRSPTIPETRERGRKTATSTMVIEMAVKPISLRPSRAAVRRSFPISRWR